METQILEPAVEIVEQFEAIETIAPPKPYIPSVSSYTPSYEEIAPLAYELWQQRGCPDGEPEVDWFRAEQQLIARKGRMEVS